MFMGFKNLGLLFFVILLVNGCNKENNHNIVNDSRSISESSVDSNNLLSLNDINITDPKEDDKAKKKPIITINDKIPPKLELLGSEYIELKVGDIYEEPGFYAIDNIDGNITDSVKVVNSIDNTKAGKYEVIYKVKDSSDNVASAKRVVKFIDLAELKGYYVDEPLANIDYICGSYSGKTDSNGTFKFQEGEDCEFSIASIKLETIPSDVLKDNIYIFESNVTVASFLQSLDTDENTTALEINSDVVDAIKELNITEIPTDLETFISEMNEKLKDKSIELKAKSKDETLSYLRESYLYYINKTNLYLTDKSVDLTENAKGYTKDEVDALVSEQFGDDNSTESIVNEDSKALIGNWAGEDNYMRVLLQLRKDGTYKYYSRLGIGKYHNYYRYSRYEGNWSLQNGNSQIILTLANVEAPLILTNSFPNIIAPCGTKLNGGNSIDNTYLMDIDNSQNSATASYTQSAQEYMARDTADFAVDYFTMVAPKANSEEFWSSANIKPPGYNYGHKLGLWTDEWEYAKNRIKDDPKNYTIVISDENWQTMLGNRHKYMEVIQDPSKVYRWFEYFKAQMQILGEVEGTVLYIFGGDAPPFWASDIRQKYNNDPKTALGKIIESRFPEVLERNPSNSFAGIFQMMDYLRMKYAPNVKLGYTLKTWGIAEKDIYHEPSEGWDSADTVKVMADYLNNYDVQFDFLSFNFHPRSSHTTAEYESAAKYFGAISKQLRTRDETTPKLWIWKISLWNTEQPEFYFTHIDFLVNECNAVGMTLGHGNDLSGKSGFSDDEDKEIYIRSWIDEYYNHKIIDSIPVHATEGPINWR